MLKWAEMITWMGLYVSPSRKSLLFLDPLPSLIPCLAYPALLLRPRTSVFAYRGRSLSQARAFHKWQSHQYGKPWRPPYIVPLYTWFYTCLSQDCAKKKILLLLHVLAHLAIYIDGPPESQWREVGRTCSRQSFSVHEI